MERLLWNDNRNCRLRATTRFNKIEEKESLLTLTCSCATVNSSNCNCNCNSNKDKRLIQSLKYINALIRALYQIRAVCDLLETTTAHFLSYDKLLDSFNRVTNFRKYRALRNKDGNWLHGKYEIYEATTCNFNSDDKYTSAGWKVEATEARKFQLIAWPRCGVGANSHENCDR